MKKVFLLHQFNIQHYRVPIYNYLSVFLGKHGYELIVISEGIENTNYYSINFKFYKTNLKTLCLLKYIKNARPDVIIFFVNLKNFYLFPIISYCKMKNTKIIYWGHARDLMDKDNKVKNFFYNLEHALFDGLLLYSYSLKKFVKKRFYSKTFIANNTLNLTDYDYFSVDKKSVLNKYNILTTKNIICMGRMQKRKRIKDLFLAFKIINRNDVGLILSGCDEEGILNNMKGNNIYKLGPIYGKDAIELLSSCDIYCMPGSVGLSIVDALYCGLPFITEKNDHGPEIFYLEDGLNGYIVDKGDVSGLANKIDYLLNNDSIRSRFSYAAKNIVKTKGHINTMCKGFLNILNFLTE